MKLETIENSVIKTETTYFILVSFPKQGNGTTYKNIFTSPAAARRRARAILKTDKSVDSVCLRMETVFFRDIDNEFSSSGAIQTISRHGVEWHGIYKNRENRP